MQFGGQTPLRLAVALEQRGRADPRHPPDAIDRAEDRERFAELLEQLGLRAAAERHRAQPSTRRSQLGRADRLPGAGAALATCSAAARCEIVHDGRALRRLHARGGHGVSPEHPVLVDRFLADATEVDVDAICDGKHVVIGGIMEHIEEAGDPLGRQRLLDAAVLALPRIVDRGDHAMRPARARARARRARPDERAVRGRTRQRLYVLEVNPRASRTVPFVSKAIGRAAREARRAGDGGQDARRARLHREIVAAPLLGEEAVFPFVKFPGADTLLGPEMKSTGEVMGIDSRVRPRLREGADRARACDLPTSGTVLVIAARRGQGAGASAVLRVLQDEGFTRWSRRRGTADFLRDAGSTSRRSTKVREGSPHVEDADPLRATVALVDHHDPDR